MGAEVRLWGQKSHVVVWFGLPHLSIVFKSSLIPVKG